MSIDLEEELFRKIKKLVESYQDCELDAKFDKKLKKLCVKFGTSIYNNGYGDGGINLAKKLSHLLEREVNKHE